MKQESIVLYFAQNSNIINMIHQTEFLKTNYFTACVSGVGGYPNSLINIKYLPCGGKIYLPWTYYSE